MIRCALILAAASALAACASPRATSTTSLTAADAPNDEAPAAREATPEAAPAAVPAPPGQLVCRTKDGFGVVSELYLEWSGASASGVIRSTAPSGMVSERRVRGERHKDSIVLDDPGQTDLVTHAAIVTTRGGKQHIRLADAGDAWSTCD